MGWFSTAISELNQSPANSKNGDLIKTQMQPSSPTSTQTLPSSSHKKTQQHNHQQSLVQSMTFNLPDSYDALLTQKATLTNQLKQLALVLHDQSSPEVRELHSQLQLEKTRQQGIMQQAQQRLAEISPQLEALDQGAEAILLEAISQQAWYAFKNKREIIFDSRTGDVYPNFEYVQHVSGHDWKQAKKTYALSGIKGDWQMLHEVFYIDLDKGKRCGFLNSEIKSDYDERTFDYPIFFRGKQKVNISIFCDKSVNRNLSYPAGITEFSKTGSNTCVSSNRGPGSDVARTLSCVMPVLKVLNNPDLLPDHPRLTEPEKAKIILDFFIAEDWIPIFEPFLDKNDNEDDDDYQDRVAAKQRECDEYNRLFDAYYQRIQLERQLIAIKQKLETLPPPAPDNPFTATFDYRQALHEQQYDLNNINQSVWQYSQAIQTWVRFLLTQLDDITQRQQPLLAQAAELKHALTAKPISSKHLTDTEFQLLQARHHDLQQRLDFGIEPVRAALFSVLQQAQTLQNQLQQAHQYPDSLMRLAELERQPRPSFNLVAEHTATLCTQALTKLEWLEQSLDFVQAIVQSEQQHTESYLVLLDKYQADLLQQGTVNSIEASDVQQWFTEWRQQHLIAQQQWQPLVQAGLEHVLPSQAVLDTLQAMQHYQQAVDQFYLSERLGIHTTYAFQANGHRQEKLEKEQKLTELRHKLMQQLEAVIFALPSSVEKIWLVRWVEVWQQGLVQAITDLLQHEQLIERDDIVQIMLEDMRKVQQQNLAACLQDAKSYSQALAMREKDTATLIFKMRKALMK